MRRRFIQPMLLGVLLFSLACAGSSAIPIPKADLSSDAVFFVVNHGRDGRNIDQVIVHALKDRGLQVSGGPVSARPKHVDFLVTYEDRWAWDMRTYLREITIEVTNAATGAKVAESRSHQGSLGSMGNSWQEIIQRTASQLLEDTPGQKRR